MSEGLLDNDSDPDGDAIFVQLVEDALHGKTQLSSDGSFVFTPDDDFFGMTSFTYRVSDSFVESDIATVTIDVQPGNDIPHTEGEVYNVAVNTELNVDAAQGVLANDQDVDGDTLTAKEVQAPAFGTLTLEMDGAFRYEPNVDFHGTDTFKYVANDGFVDSEPTTVAIFVNSPPMVEDDFYTMDQDVLLVVREDQGLLANDQDPNGDAISVRIAQEPSDGVLNLDSDGSFEFEPSGDFVGTVTFTYIANDGFADSSEASVTINVVARNRPPTAHDDVASVAEDQSVTIETADLLANDVDPESDTLMVKLVSDPANGSLVFDSGFIYSPNPDFNGVDQFTYVATDGESESNLATVTITVTAINDAPTTVADSYSVTPNEPFVVSGPFGVLANDFDVDGDAFTALAGQDPSHGALQFNEDGSFTYTPDTDFTGTDSFTYFAEDENSRSAETTVGIRVESNNAAPTALDDQFEIDEDATLFIAIRGTGGILSNDFDPDGDNLIANIMNQPTHGSLSFDGELVYTPDLNFVGTDSFRYNVSDGRSNSNDATVTIIVNAVNDPPVAVGDEYENEGGTLSIDVANGVLANDSDVDNSSLSASLVLEPAHGVVDLRSDGSFVYSPAPEFWRH